MKKLFLLFSLALLMTACDNFNNPQQGGNSTSNDEYYVKYTIKSGGPYLYFSDIYYADTYGVGSAEKSHSIKSWTITIGPVKKGFKAFVKNEKGTGNNQIEVSKNNGPFAIKNSGQNSASYTINY